MKYHKKLIGEICYLSPVNLDDLERYTEWVNDMETGLFVLFASSVYDENKEKETLEYLTRHQVIMAIIEKETNKPVGTCGLHEVNNIHRHATFGIHIGDKNYWNHGIGTEATCLMLDFGFNVLNLNSIQLDVMDFNKRAIKCYEKCGFKYAGTKRKAVFTAGAYHDILIYDMLAEDFTSPYIKVLYNKMTSTKAGSEKLSIV